MHPEKQRATASDRGSQQDEMERGLLRGLLLDVFHHVTDGLKFFRVFVRDFDGKHFLEGHDELDGVERIGTEILDERRAGRDLLRVDAELLDDDVFDFLLNGFFRHKMGCG